jgi:carboxylesterase
VKKAITSGESSQAGIAALPGNLMLELRWLVRQVRREISHVRQPTLIVHPRRHDRASMRNVNYLQSMLSGLTETLVLEDSYHLVTLDRHRHLVLGRTLEFVSEVTRRATCPAGDEHD